MSSDSSNTKLACMAALSVSVGVIVGVVASSSPVATSLYAPATVTATRSVATMAPVSNMQRAAVYQREYVPEPEASIAEAPEQVEFVTAPQSNVFNVAATALFAASAAAGAVFLVMKKKVVSGYEAIRDVPPADMVSAAGKAFGVAATTAVLAGSANAASLTFDEKYSLSYMEMKGSGLSNTCPIIADGTGNKLNLKAGKYKIDNMCLEPSSFQVKVPSPDGGKTVTDFEKTKLMTRLTYTLDGIRADLTVGGDGSWSLKEIDGIDYAATTVQLAGGERVPFLFTIKNLDAKGDAGQFLGQFDVSSYRGATFLDPKGRGAATGYDNAVALPAAGDTEELAKENNKSAASSVGTIAFKVAKVNAETGEIAGVFESIQPSDTDLGAKVPKDIKTSGVWYAQISSA